MRRRSLLVLVVTGVALATTLAGRPGAADAAPGHAVAAASGWSLQPVPPVSVANGSLAAISCGGPRACVAVGSYTDRAGDQAPLTLAGNGRSWSIAVAPDPGSSSGAALSAVSCPSAGFCVATGTRTAGTGQSYPLAERWHGGHWSILAMPNPVTSTHTVLTGVACASATACIAVGYFDNPYFTQTLAEAWNGHRWSVQRTQNVPNPASTVWGELNGIWCLSAKACVAVGDYQGSLTQSTLAESWNGATWSIKPTPNVPGEPGNALSAVSCRSARQCLAVGDYTTSTDDTGPLALAWNGRAWSVEKTPRPAGARDSYLDGAACPSASVCLAVGAATAGGTDRTLAERWNGRTWSVKPAPLPSGTGRSELNGIWCRSARPCVAVGDDSAGITTRTLAQTWSGSAWSLTRTPDQEEPQASQLNAVSCTAPDRCVAVGDYTNASGSRPLTELWNGQAWSIAAAPSPAGTQAASLAAVSCAAAASCVAVGTSFNGTVNVTLAEAWNGTHWSVAPTPNVADAQASILSAVSCPAAGHCTAVGYYATATVTGTLAETWNGSAWSISQTPDAAGSAFTTLTGVSCPVVNRCVAVGGYTTAPSPLAIAETWNGSAWAIQALPSPQGASGTFPQGVSCTSATDCTAVGNYYNGTDNVPLAEALTGTAWAVQATPAPAGVSYAALDAVSCPAAGDCVAAGYATSSSAPTAATLAAAWNGHGWTAQPVPNPGGAQQSYLFGVSCPRPGSCAAIGYYAQTLAALPVPLAARYQS
jgi:hypothetical protein